MKRIGLLTLIVLALNFVAIAAGLGYLVGTGKLDQEKAKQVAKVVFPDPPAPASQPALETQSAATTQPLLRFDELLARQTGKTAAEQVAFLRATFDSMSAQLDRQRREVLDLKRQVDLAQAQATRDRVALDARTKALDDRANTQRTLENDAGFKMSLEVYEAMDVKQIKEIFLQLDEETVVRYLQAMEPRRVSRIVKEFTTPEELSKAQSLLEKMRKNDASQEAASASSKSPASVQPAVLR